jgi:HSP20 family molecular chaperone IbpA
VEKSTLFGLGCPICGWVSPFGMIGELNAEKNSLHVDIVEDDDTVRITAEGQIIEKTYRNGVLEVKLRKIGR